MPGSWLPDHGGRGYSENNLLGAYKYCTTDAVDPATRVNVAHEVAYAIAYYGSDGPDGDSDGHTSDDWYCLYRGPIAEGTCEGYRDCIADVPGGFTMSAEMDACMFCGYDRGYVWIRNPQTYDITPAQIRAAGLIDASPPSWPPGMEPRPPPSAPNRLLQAQNCFVLMEDNPGCGDAKFWSDAARPHLVDMGTNDEYEAKITCIDTYGCFGVAREETYLPGSNWQMLTVDLSPPEIKAVCQENSKAWYRAPTYVAVGWDCAPDDPPSPPPAPPGLPPPCTDSGVLTQNECVIGKLRASATTPASLRKLRVHVRAVRLRDTGDLTGASATAI